MPEKSFSLPSFFVFDEPNLWCNRLEINRVSDGLAFNYWTNTALVKKQKYIKDKDYKIANEWIELERVSEWFTSGAVDARTSIKRNLTINDEGDLIIRAKRSNLELFFYMPAFGSSDVIWVMSKRINGTD